MHGLAKRQAPEASSCYASEAARAGSGASRKLIAVAKVRITEAGRDALEDSGKASVKSREGLTTIKSWCSLRTRPVKTTGKFQPAAGLPVLRRVLLRGASEARRRLISSISNCCGSKSPPHHSRSSL